MLYVKQVVRHGKGFIVFACIARPALGAALSHQLGRSRGLSGNSNSSRSEAGASLSAANGTVTHSRVGESDELLKTKKNAPPPPPERPDVNGSSSTNSSSTNSSSSSSSSSSSEDVVERDRKSLKESVRDVVAQFTRGTKVLWVDFKASRQTSKRKKAGEALTFQEHRQLRQVGRDLAKALPVLTVFSLPFAGYLAPALGYIFPKTMLPPQFWSSPQRLHFMLEDASKQEVSLFPKLLNHLAMLAASPRSNSSPQQLQYSTKWFWREGSLNKLTRAHLVRLVKACNTVPPFKKATANFAPTSWLVTWLQNEASSLSNDDLALRKEFYSRRRTFLQKEKGGGGGSKAKLTAMEVLVLCWERGLLRSSHWPEVQLRRKAAAAGGANAAVDEPIPDAVAKAMLRSLEEYLALYDTPSVYGTPEEIGHLEMRSSSSSASSEDGDEDGPADHLFSCSGSGAALPPSMLLHAPALLRINPSARGSGSSPLCHLRVEKPAR